MSWTAHRLKDLEPSQTILFTSAPLAVLAVSFNWLYGSVPSKLVVMAALSNLRFSYNYLPGSLPKPGATLKVLDTQANFLSGTFPTTALAPIVSPSVAKVPNSAAAPTLTMASAAVPLDATSVSALLSLGAALGVRDTNWRNGSKCNIEGQTANFKTWPGVWCIANGTVLNITLPNKELRGIIHADISKLNALSYLYVPTLNLNPTQRGVRLAANYLTGTLLAMATQLQRTSGCAVCGSATGAPPFCAGTTCTPDVAARLAAGTINNPAAALPAMFCQAVLVDDNSVLALLALRAGLGVSASSWAVDSPYKLAGNAPAVDSSTGVVCDLSAQVLSLCVWGFVLCVYTMCDMPHRV
ncbi:unnamed protein product [Closterium sp. NIES-64]|nr:unnamed protein product [Closterium sp. NIES-64]